MRFRFIACLLCATTLPLVGQQVPVGADSPEQVGTFRFELPLSPTPPREGAKIFPYGPSCLDRTGNPPFCHLSPPFVSIFEEDAVSMEGRSDVEEWVDIRAVRDGARLASLIQEQSKQGPHSCENNDCSWIVASNSLPTAYFSCRTDQSFPIPRSCRPVLFESDSGPMMLAKTGLSFFKSEVSHAQTPPPRSLDTFSPGRTQRARFTIQFPKEKMSDEEIRTAITRSLSQPQLSLTEGPSSITGAIVVACGPRKSKINIPQWEMIQILANLYQKSPEEIDVEYQAVCWVNEQNTDRNIDWHLPTPEQLKRVTDEIEHNLRAALSEVCHSVSWSGTSLSCHQ
jgi:hypothetical protein